MTARFGAGPSQLNVLVVGFITIDRIELPLRTITSVGGPPCYAGLLLARLGLDVTAATKIGADFPNEQMIWLARNGLRLRSVDVSPTKKTTRFKIVKTKSKEERTLYLTDRCEDIAPSQIPDRRYDAALVSPLANEVSDDVLQLVRSHSDFCFLDPQGFVRHFDGTGKVSVDRWADEKDLRMVDAMKLDIEEAEAITGKRDAKLALTKLYELGLRKAIVTHGGESAFVLDGSRLFRIDVPQVKIVDTTGAGDILAAGITGTYLRSRDFLRSCCFGVAASSLSLNMIALAKIDLPQTVDQQARMLYSSASPVGSAN